MATPLSLQLEAPTPRGASRGPGDSAAPPATPSSSAFGPIRRLLDWSPNSPYLLVPVTSRWTDGPRRQPISTMCERAGAVRSTGEALGGGKGSRREKSNTRVSPEGEEWSDGATPSTFTFCLDVCTRSAHAPQKDGQDWFGAIGTSNFFQSRCREGRPSLNWLAQHQCAGFVWSQLWVSS